MIVKEASHYGPPEWEGISFFRSLDDYAGLAMKRLWKIPIVARQHRCSGSTIDVIEYANEFGGTGRSMSVLKLSLSV